METWLDSHIDDHALFTDGFGTSLRLDRDKQSTGKEHRSGVCSTAIIHESLSKTDIELLAVSLCPFYLPREIPQLFCILVDIHPKTNANTASEHIINTSLLIDWNRSHLIPPNLFWEISITALWKKSLRRFQQYITCATRFDRVLDKCYGSVPGAAPSSWNC